MQIAFWSPNHGQTGTTTTAIISAIALAMNHPYKVLLGHSHFARSTMERCLLKSNRLDFVESVFNDKGLEALRRLAKNGRLMPEMVSDYTTSLLANQDLDLLEGLNRTETLNSNEDLSLLCHIFEMADKAYDIVCIDVHSGMNQSLTKRLLDQVDVVLVCLNQNTWLLDDFANDQLAGLFLKSKCVLYHLSAYDEASKYTVKNIQKIYGITPILTTPYNVDLMDGANSGNLLDFILRLMELPKKDRQYNFSTTIAHNAKELALLMDSLSQKEYA